MRIAEFSDTFLPLVDGVGNLVNNYVIEFMRKGHDCTVVSTKTAPHPIPENGLKVLECKGVTVPGAPQYKYALPAIDPAFKKALNICNFDVINAHSPFAMGKEALRIARQKGIPIVGSIHTKYYEDFKKVLKLELVARFGVWTVVDFYNRCDEVWAGNAFGAEMLKDYGFKGEIVVMEGGAPNNEVDEADPQQARCTFNLTSKPLLLFVGRLHENKNIGRFLEASAILRKEGLEHQVVIAGTGPEATSLQRTAKALGIQEYVVFTGHITDKNLLFGLYSLADIFVFPSIRDMGGMVVKEAAAFGVPSLVVKHSGPSEGVIHNFNGLLCDDDAKDIADVLKRYLPLKDDLRSMGKEARRTLCASWANVADNVLARYSSLILAGSRYSRKER